MKINAFFLCIALLASFSLFGQPTYSMADTVLAKRYLEEAKVLIDSARYDEALGKLDSAEVILERTVGKEDTTYAKVLDQKGRCFYEKADYEHAIEYHQKSLEIRLKKLGSEHSDVANSYNNLGNPYYRKGDLDRGIEYFQKALEMRLKKLGSEHPDVAVSYNNLGSVYSSKGDYDRAIEYHQKSLEVRLKKLGSEHPDVAVSYNNLGSAYSSKGDYDRAIEYYQKALAIWLKTFGSGHLYVATSSHNLGIAYFSKGDYDRAMEYHQKALEIQLKKLGSEHPAVASSYHNLGNAYSGKGDYNRAIEYYQKALEIQLKKSGLEHSTVATSFSYNTLGNAYSFKHDYDSAIEYQQKALEIQLKKLGSEHPAVAASYNNLGIVYRSKGDYDRAIEYHQKALEIRLKKLGSEHPAVATSYNNLGNEYSRKGDYDRAIEYHQKALEIRLKKLGSEHPYVAVSYKNLGKLYKSKVNYSQSTACFKKALFSINAFRKNLENPSSKSALSKESAGVYEGGININHLLYFLTDSLLYLHEAFHYAEQSKALSLYESMKNAEALHLAGIPNNLLQQEYDLRVNIGFYEKRRQDLYSDGKDGTDTIVLSISSKLFDLHRAYEQLIDTFEVRYSDYYRLKYDLRTEDVASIQRELLQPDQAMIEYYVGDSSVFIFMMKKDDYRVIEIKKDFPLEDWVRQLQHGIYGYRMESETDIRDPNAANEYTEAAWRLYQKLLAPVDSLLPRRVVVIPDGVLGYIPFGALLTEKPVQSHRFQSHPYFCREHDISYCYSATLLREMTQRQHKKEPKGSLLAFAPFYEQSYRQLEDLFGKVDPLAADTSSVLIMNRKNFDPLPRSGEEAAAISKIWDGRHLINADATETRFSQMAGDYRILHLATHGVADNRAGDYSFLAFAQIPDSIENELLYVREIYNLSLNADLVTLSACETGIGELRRGEGIISLARAFSYAGAKGIATTLWTVDDARTKDLMISFYQNLKKGMTKDAALAQTQRGFLATPYAHPYYWAGFVAIGDMGAVGSSGGQ